MAHLRFGFVFKSLALCTTALFLSGCYKIEIKETLNLDGTSNIAIKMDISQMMSGMGDMAEGLVMMSDDMGVMMGDVPEGMMLEMEAAAKDMTPADLLMSQDLSFTGCDDPLLLEEFGVTDLTEPSKQTVTLEIDKATTCEPSLQEGFINIVETHSNNPGAPNIIERKAESCDDPAILAFYQIPNFDTPIIETFTIENQITTTCRENDIEVIVSTLITELPAGEPNPASFYFNKVSELGVSDISSDEFTDDIDNMMDFSDLETGEAMDTLLADMSFCEETDQDPNEVPFFFDKCEDIAPGIGAFHFTKYDTTGFTVNSNGTVTYNLEPSTSPIQEDLDEGLSENQGGNSLEMDPASMGFVVDYVMVSPWPILEHSAGVLEDPYTLRVNLLEADETQSLTVTLDTDGNTLDLLDPQIQNQIDKLIASLEAKLTSSSAPVERQVEYIFHLSNKIQRLAAIKPEVQVPLGYLQTKLIELAQRLERHQFEDLDEMFFEDLENLTLPEEAEAPTEDIDEEAEITETEVTDPAEDESGSESETNQEDLPETTNTAEDDFFEVPDSDESEEDLSDPQDDISTETEETSPDGEDEEEEEDLSDEAPLVLE